MTKRKASQNPKPKTLKKPKIDPNWPDWRKYIERAFRLAGWECTGNICALEAFLYIREQRGKEYSEKKEMAELASRYSNDPYEGNPHANHYNAWSGVTSKLMNDLGIVKKKGNPPVYGLTDTGLQVARIVVDRLRESRLRTLLTDNADVQRAGGHGHGNGHVYDHGDGGTDYEFEERSYFSGSAPKRGPGTRKRGARRRPKGASSAAVDHKRLQEALQRSGGQSIKPSDSISPLKSNVQNDAELQKVLELSRREEKMRGKRMNASQKSASKMKQLEKMRMQRVKTLEDVSGKHGTSQNSSSRARSSSFSSLSPSRPSSSPRRSASSTILSSPLPGQFRLRDEPVRIEDDQYKSDLQKALELSKRESENAQNSPQHSAAQKSSKKYGNRKKKRSNPNDIPKRYDSILIDSDEEMGELQATSSNSSSSSKSSSRELEDLKKAIEMSKQTSSDSQIHRSGSSATSQNSWHADAQENGDSIDDFSDSDDEDLKRALSLSNETYSKPDSQVNLLSDSERDSDSQLHVENSSSRISPERVDLVDSDSDSDIDVQIKFLYEKHKSVNYIPPKRKHNSPSKPKPKNELKPKYKPQSQSRGHKHSHPKPRSKKTSCLSHEHPNRKSNSPQKSKHKLKLQNKYHLSEQEIPAEDNANQKDMHDTKRKLEFDVGHEGRSGLNTNTNSKIHFASNQETSNSNSKPSVKKVSSVKSRGNFNSDLLNQNISSLLPMGFEKNDIINALKAKNNSLSDALELLAPSQDSAPKSYDLSSSSSAYQSKDPKRKKRKSFSLVVSDDDE